MKTPPTRRVWVFVTPRSQLIDAIGPYEVLRYATSESETGGYDLSLVSAGDPDLQFNSGISLRAHASLEQAAAEGLPHTVIVAGGGTDIREGTDEYAIAHWLREHEAVIPRICSVCSGAFTLAAAGLLDQRRATTHWQLVPELGRRHPLTTVENGGIFVQDGKVWTAAGMTAGIDMALALVENDIGHGVSLDVARLMVLYLRRPGGQRQFSKPLEIAARGGPLIQRTRDAVLRQMHEPISVPELAKRVGVSPRTLSRRITAITGRGPGAFIREVKLAESRRLLEQTELSVAQIADEVGLGEEGTFRRRFRAELGTSPSEYRSRFGRA